MPAGDYRTQDAKVTPPPRGRIDASMEALIHHFKLFTEGFRVPTGEVYTAVESPRGELGMYLVSDDSAKPFRLHVRGPSFVNLQAVPAAHARRLDVRHRHRHLDGRPGHGRGGPVSHLRPELRQRAEELVALYPHRARRCAALPPRPGAGRLPQRRRRWSRSPSSPRRRRPRCAAPRRSTTCSTSSPSGRYVVGICTNIACLLAGGIELLEHAERALGVRRRRDDARRRVHLEECECLADCDVAPCVQVNSRFVRTTTPEAFDALVAELRAGGAGRRDPGVRDAVARAPHDGARRPARPGRRGADAGPARRGAAGVEGLMAKLDAPRIVTSRMGFDDSYTLSRYLATGGYDALTQGARDVAGRRRGRGRRRLAARPRGRGVPRGAQVVDAAQGRPVRTSS